MGITVILTVVCIFSVFYDDLTFIGHGETVYPKSIQLEIEKESTGSIHFT
jgi:hypothetical protein